MKTRHSRSLDHVNWWDPAQWRKGPRSLSPASLEADPSNIRNGWLTLTDTKARFQQKQMAEREMKIASLYEAQQARALDRVRQSPAKGAANGTSPPPALGPLPQGKVRQMFEERRTKGIDKSYPLQPIHNTGSVKKTVTTSNSVTKTSHNRVVEKRTNRTSHVVANHNNNNNVVRKHVKSENNHTINGDVNHNHEIDLNTVKRTLQQIVDSSKSVSNGAEEEAVDGRDLLENETFPDALAPTPTPRSTDSAPRRPARRSPAMKASPVKQQPVAPSRRTNSDITNSGKKPASMQKSVTPILRKQSAVSTSKARGPAPGQGGGDACAVCGRRFAPDRLAKHEAICKKTSSKKRKPFDALKHRLAGTEAEPLIGKLRKGTTQSSTKVAPKLNNNWRQKHEEFISAIRAAKQVQQHLNAGGKLSDLPPPPPSENPDYVGCPHCGRRFNQAAADRHIPKCASYQFNKAKPTNTRKR